MFEQCKETVVYLKEKSVGYENFKEFKENMELNMQTLESVSDKNANLVKELENWTDIYLPIRLQHQNTETIKPTLATKKAKTVLGKTDELIINELKQRVLNDVGNPQLQERCLEVIKRLKLDAKILNQENVSIVK